MHLFCTVNVYITATCLKNGIYYVLRQFILLDYFKLLCFNYMYQYVVTYEFIIIETHKYAVQRIITVVCKEVLVSA
jgi:hypothetical protein